MQLPQTNLGIFTDVIPPRGIKLVVTLQYFSEHILVSGLAIERFIATQPVSKNGREDRLAER